MKFTDAAKWEKLGAPAEEDTKRQAGWPLKKEIHLEGRESGHIPAEGNPVIVPEVWFWPAWAKRLDRQQGCRKNPGPISGMSPVKLRSPLPQSQQALPNAY